MGLLGKKKEEKNSLILDIPAKGAGPAGLVVREGRSIKSPALKKTQNNKAHKGSTLPTDTQPFG